MPPESKLKKLEELLKLVNESISRDEFVQAFENVLKHVIDAEKKSLGRVDEKMVGVIDGLTAQVDALKLSSTKDFTSLKKEIQTTIDAIKLEQKNTMNFVYDKVSKLKNGKDGRDGRAGLDGRAGKDGKDGKDGVDGKDGAPGRGGGGKGFTLYVNGVKKLFTAQTLNITGSGVTYNFANGRNDVTITGGSGAFSVLTATGTIDGSNATFTFASEPALVVLNGMTYRNGAGVTITTTTAVFDVAPQSGSDVYGIG